MLFAVKNVNLKGFHIYRGRNIKSLLVGKNLQPVALWKQIRKIFTLRAAPIELLRVKRVPFSDYFSEASAAHFPLPNRLNAGSRRKQAVFSLARCLTVALWLDLGNTMPAACFRPVGEGEECSARFPFSLAAEKAKKFILKTVPF
jgi:hypothetical protein